MNRRRLIPAAIGLVALWASCRVWLQPPFDSFALAALCVAVVVMVAVGLTGFDDARRR